MPYEHARTLKLRPSYIFRQADIMSEGEEGEEDGGNDGCGGDDGDDGDGDDDDFTML